LGGLGLKKPEALEPVVDEAGWPTFSEEGAVTVIEGAGAFRASFAFRSASAASLCCLSFSARSLCSLSRRSLSTRSFSAAARSADSLSSFNLASFSSSFFLFASRIFIIA